MPDRLEVIYDGKIVVESNQFNFERMSNGDDFSYLKKYGGFTQYFAVFPFKYTYDQNKPTEVLVRVIPNRMYTTTEWELKVNCPQ
jgi:hypothetical protein